MLLKVLFLSAVFATIFNPTRAFNVNCFFELETAFDFTYDDIDYNICTHIFVAHAELGPDGHLQSVPEDLMREIDEYRRFINPEVKLILSIGGWREMGGDFSVVAANPASRTTFANDALTHIINTNFDGIDINWVFPGDFGGDSTIDGGNFPLLIQDVKNAFLSGGKPAAIVTATVAANPSMPGSNYAYDVPALASVVQFVNVMTYDFHIPTNNTGGVTGSNSPLRASSNDTMEDRSLANCNSAVENWYLAGMPKDKMNLGIPFHGHSFYLASPYDHSIGAPARIGINQGTMFYDEICKLADFNHYYDEEQVVPYKYLHNDWISYDDTESVRQKVDFAATWAMGGVMVWAVNYDDKEAMCGPSLALLNAIKDALPPK